MYIKPAKLNPGDKVLALSLSRGGPGACPQRYYTGKRQLEEKFGVKVIEGKYTMADPKRIYDNPQARAEDLMEGFRNTDIKAIFSTIGGEESIRILPYIDYTTIRQNPKIFMGYSDSTITHFICQKAGIVSFYGPSIMAGFGENGGLFDYMTDSVRKTLFSSEIIGEIQPNPDGWTNEFLPRENTVLQMQKRKLQSAQPWRWIQGRGIYAGILTGGCIDVFPFMQGTTIRPDLNYWKDKILFLETSEEKISENNFERILRNLGSQGILHIISGILVGRSQTDDTTGKQINYDNALLKIIKNELGLTELPIITNMDFGHTDPMFVLPIGCKARLNCNDKVLSIIENACE